jgi:hypothetical protein
VKEILIAFGVFASLAGLGWALHFATMMQLVIPGILLIAGGLIFSLPCAIWYHWLLYRTLSPRGALDSRWIWNPTAHHERLSTEERTAVMPWFYAGAAGWVLSVLGCVLLGLGAWVGRM